MLRSGFLFCCLSLALATDVVSDLPANLRLRPGAVVTFAYSLVPGIAKHTLQISGAPIGATVARVTGEDRIKVSVVGTAVAADSEVIILFKDLLGNIAATFRFRLYVDPAPVLADPGISAVFDEDLGLALVVSYNDQDEASVTATAVPTNARCHVNLIERIGVRQYSITLSGSPDAYGTSAITLTLTDLLGPKVFSIPVTIRPVNDAPTVAAEQPDPTPVYDPRSGAPVAPVVRLAITPAPDPDITMLVGDRRIGFVAEIDGVDGVDLLTLHGNSTFKIGNGSIISISSGNIQALWTAPSSRRIELTLTGNGTLAKLQEFAGLLRCSHLLQPAADLARTLRISVREPNAIGYDDRQVSCPYRVLAVNRPPEVTLPDVEVAPLGSVALPFTIVDSDSLDDITVCLTDEPMAGAVEPKSCTASQAIAGALNYHHSNTDLSSDRFTFAVTDPGGNVVKTTVRVTVRMKPERLDIVSDPLLQIVRGAAADLQVLTYPAGASLRLANYGAPLPPKPDWVALDGDRLQITWPAAAPGWLAFAIEAETTDPDDASVTWTARQRMLVRVVDPAAATPAAARPAVDN